MKLKIIEIPNPLLRQKSEPVEKVDKALSSLMKDMLETMYSANGVGLAAPQVGILKRVVVIDVAHDDEKPAPFLMANPEIIWRSEEKEECSEGCLSVPNQFASVERSYAVKVRYLNEKNEKVELLAEGFLARAVQHELDHLDGVVFIDYVSPLKRKMMIKRLEKQRRKAAKEE